MGRAIVQIFLKTRISISSGFFNDPPALCKKVKEKMNLKTPVFSNLILLALFFTGLEARASDVNGASEMTDSPSWASPGKYMFSTQPIGDVFGVFGVEVDYGIAEYWSLGTSFSYFHDVSVTGNRSTRAIQYGLVGTLFPWHPRFTSGLFVRTEVDILTDNTERVSNFAHSANTVEVIQLGYSWLLPQHVIVGWGVGVAYFQGDNGPGVDPSYLFQVGWSPL